MKIQELMHKDVKCCRPEDSFDSAASLMWNFDIGTLPVVDREAHAIGMITDRDICMPAYTQGASLGNIRVESVARKVIACGPDDDLETARRLMAENQVRRLPVIDSAKRPAGNLTISDLAREAEERAGDGISGEVITDTLAAIAAPRAPAPAATAA